MWEVLDKYQEKFGDQFPLYMMQGADEEEIIKTAQKCIDIGKPFEYKKEAVF